LLLGFSGFAPFRNFAGKLLKFGRAKLKTEDPLLDRVELAALGGSSGYRRLGRDA
jgi:hypothetical protein